MGAAFLLAGNGLHGLLLPMRGTAEGFSPTSLGFLGTPWATGFVLGCLFAQRLVRRIGHVRAFSAFASLIAIIALLTGLLVDPYWWIALRAVTGFSLAATSMIIESWLNERATNESRGAIFSFYMTINYTALVAGQMSIALGDIHTATFFMIAGILYCLALLPTAVSTAVSPAPLKEVSLDLKGLYRNSPVSFVGIFLVGIANGCFGTLGPVFGGAVHLSQTTIALLMSVTIFSGAVFQFPAGRLSDRMDRRYVLTGVAGTAGLAGLVLALGAPSHIDLLFALVALYGAMSYTLYPVTVAHANDFADPQNYVKVSSGLLLLYGLGTIVGPTIGGFAMAAISPYALFAVTAAAHLGVAAYAIVRIRMRAPVPSDERDAFHMLPSSRVATPESFALSPKAGSSDQPAE
jgi:MFS family permease